MTGRPISSPTQPARTRRPLAGRLLPLAGMAVPQDGADDADQECQDRPAERRVPIQHRAAACRDWTGRPRRRCARPGAGRAGPAAPCTRTAIAAAAGCRAVSRHRMRSTSPAASCSTAGRCRSTCPRIVASTMPTTDTFSVFRIADHQRPAVGIRPPDCRRSAIRRSGCRRRGRGRRSRWRYAARRGSRWCC